MALPPDYALDELRALLKARVCAAIDAVDRGFVHDLCRAKALELAPHYTRLADECGSMAEFFRPLVEAHPSPHAQALFALVRPFLDSVVREALLDYLDAVVLPQLQRLDPASP
jgi:hypothetical protein